LLAEAFMLSTPQDFVPLMSARDTGRVLHFVLHRDRLLLTRHGLELPELAAVQQLGLQQPLPMGLWQGRYCQAWRAASEDTPGPEHSWHPLRSLFGTLGGDMLALAGRACQLVEWQRTHRYCGACGSGMAHLAGERAFKCPSCGFTAYPRISPAMMVLIRKGDAVLLARHAQSPYQRFTALAGFLEAGESVEEAVHREVYEEVGLRVHNLQYFGSQSWPFPHSLMIAFTADYLDGEIRVDDTEIAEARWFGPGDGFPEIPPGVSIAAALIAAHRPTAEP
jgi:NAD+ diphosphatase